MQVRVNETNMYRQVIVSSFHLNRNILIKLLTLNILIEQKRRLFGADIFRIFELSPHLYDTLNTST